MRRTVKICLVISINLLLVAALSEALFTAYYFIKDGKYISVTEKLANEKSSFDVEKQKTVPCNKYNNILAPHPYLTFIHVSRPECNSYANNTGHRGPDVPLVKNKNDFVVMILGGSVANQLYQFKKDNIQSYFQKRHPDKNVIVLNGSLEGWKQPQQLFMLQMYGEVLDAAISIEGYNEMMFNRRLDYRVRFDTPFLPGYRKANAAFLTDKERGGIWLSGKLFDLVNNNRLLRHSKTAYFLSAAIREKLEQQLSTKDDLNSLQEGSLQHLDKIFALPPEWPLEARRNYAIEQYIKYLSLMNATAKQYRIPFAVFLQPAPAVLKPLSTQELTIVGDLDYKNDYLLFEQKLIAHNKEFPIYSLLNIFNGVNENIYKDGIHFYEESSGPTRIMSQIYQILDEHWKLK